MTDVQALSGDALLSHTAALRSLYVDAFCAPPWNEDESRATEFTDRLLTDVRRPGFAAAVAVREGEPVGFATGWTTLDPFPGDRSYPQVVAALGARDTADWLMGAREIDTLVVSHAAHGTGVASSLLRTVVAGAPGGRSWLLTSAGAPRAVAFYRREGWAQVTHPSPDGKGIVVFLGPGHPGAALAAEPL
ncbi:GNAT family N-acetyltransferase [Streptomyces sp. NPDC091377]|uniref:GNAT family N-acetyltransferase n=1 Tax=Streptomyces sp. NPDC091377 TaxID=3365995 RepID=UPI00382F4CA0